MPPQSNSPMVLRGLEAGQPLRVSRTFEERLGLRASDLATSPLLEWLHPEDHARFEAAVAEGADAIEARHRGGDGQWLPFLWRISSDRGVPVVLGRLLEEPAGPGATSLSGTRGAQDSMAATLEAMVHIVEAKNPGLRCSILLVDEKRERVIVGAGPSLPPEYNAAVEGLRIGPAVGSCGTAAYWNVPVVVEDIANDPLWRDLQPFAAMAGVAACWSHPISTMNGDVLGAMALYDSKPGGPAHGQMEGLEIAARMVGLAVERSRLEEQLRQAAKMEALGVLAGGIAHDFNNLLAAVLGNAELALLGMSHDDPARRMLQEIVSASCGASELCGQLLAYAGRRARSVEPLDCNALVLELGGLLQVAIPKKAALHYDLAPSGLGVTADRSQLRQVLMNLITNAAEALGNEAGSIVVATSAQHVRADEQPQHTSGGVLEPGEYVCIQVSDTGCGMDSATQQRIFDPFFTTKAQGRGLGLAAVQGIVRGHAGVISLESQPGSGTTFRVLLPRSEMPSSNETPDRGGAPAPAGRRVLVVDDEPRVLRILGDMLERAGYSVTRASDGEDAIRAFRAENGEFDCVLLDLSMPKLDGEEVFGELRRIRPDVRVVLSSGYAEQEILDRFRGAGLAGVIQKPARMDVLLARIDEAVARAR